MRRIAAFILSLSLCACESSSIGAREKGALTGGAIGAGLGAIVGNQAGHHAGSGAAIGGAIGALSGAIIGNSIDQADAQLAESDRLIAEQERELQENRRLIEELKSRGADARLSDRGVVVNLPDVLFEFGSAQLTGEAQGTIKEIAGVLRGTEGRRVAVEGHTDSIGTVAYNQRLSEDRAQNVGNELVANGVSRRLISTRGFGESDPIASNKTDYGRARNRRVEVILENR